MKKTLLRYLTMLKKGVIGISIELIYPLIVTVTAFFLCLIMYISEISHR
jgi:hypothetical protein